MLVAGWGCCYGYAVVVVWLVEPRLCPRFPLTLALSRGGERGLLVAIGCDCCIERGGGGAWWFGWRAVVCCCWIGLCVV